MRGKTSWFFGLAVMLLALLLGACEADDVTGPVEARNAPPITDNTNNSTYSITVSATPNEFDRTQGGQAQILVSARRNDNNQIVAPGTTALLSTTSGTLFTAEGQNGNSVPIVFDEAGQARATLSLAASDFDTSATIRAQIESSFGSTQVRLVEVENVPFQILSVSPNFGPPSGGTPITITGSGFESPVRVELSGGFGTVLAENVRQQGSTRITATAPPINLAFGSNASATVTVTNDLGGETEATDSLTGAFTYTRSTSGTTTLKVFAVTPTLGPNEGGTQVTITGEGFGTDMRVTFGSLVEATVLSATPTRIVAITPAATGLNAAVANSTVSVSVTDLTTGQTGTLGQAFRYGGGAMFISSISPGEGEYLGGDTVTIFGQGFEEPVAVTSGGVAQQVLSVSGTEVLIRTVPVNIGCSASSGGTTVTNLETNESVSGPGFTYRPVQPQLFSVSPSTGVGGDQVTVFGAARGFAVGFDPPIRITFDGIPAGILGINGTFGDQVEVSVPVYTEDYDTEDCGDGTEGAITTFVNVGVTNLNTGCSDTLANGFGYEPPENLTCGNLSQPPNQDDNPSNATITFSNIGLIYEFEADGIPPLQAYEWWFDVDPNTEMAQSDDPMPTHLFDDPDTQYTVTLRYINSLSNDGIVTRTITTPSP